MEIILAGLDEVQIEFAGNWNPDTVHGGYWLYLMPKRLF